MTQLARHLWLPALTAALTHGACGSSPTAPTVPTPAASVVQPAPQPPAISTRRLTGIVRDGSSRPVAGASVVTYGSNGVKHAVATDSSGFYDTVAEINTQYAVPWIYVDVTKPGYEDTRNGALLKNVQDTTADFYLFALERMTAGSETQLAVTFDGPLCGFELEYACRHLQVIAPTSGTLTIEVIADVPSTTVAFGPVTYPPSKSSRIARPVRAGETMDAEILLISATPWGGTHTFRVRTALTP